jgi:hypothetical protein
VLSLLAGNVEQLTLRCEGRASSSPIIIPPEKPQTSALAKSVPREERTASLADLLKNAGITHMFKQDGGPDDTRAAWNWNDLTDWGLQTLQWIASPKASLFKVRNRGRPVQAMGRAPRSPGCGAFAQVYRLMRKLQQQIDRCVSVCLGSVRTRRRACRGTHCRCRKMGVAAEAARNEDSETSDAEEEEVNPFIAKVRAGGG